MRRNGAIGIALGLSAMLSLASMVFAQEAPARDSNVDMAAVGEAVGELASQLQKHPVETSTAAGRVGLYLLDTSGGEATMIASEPDRWLSQCGSPAWSHDGKRIVFDATPGNADFSFSRIKSIALADGHLSLTDLGPGNCPSFSPTDDRLIFLINQDAVPGVQPGVWLMKSDGSDRTALSGYGRPRWSPDGHQFAVVTFSDPCDVTVIDDRPDRKSGVLHIPDQKIFS